MICRFCHRKLRLHIKVKDGVCADCRTSGVTAPMEYKKAYIGKWVPEGKADVTWRPGRPLKDVVGSIYSEALRLSRGNRTHAALLCGVCVRTIRSWIRAHKGAGTVILLVVFAFFVGLFCGQMRGEFAAYANQVEANDTLVHGFNECVRQLKHGRGK